MWLQVDSVPSEMMAYTKGPRLSAVRRDRDLMTWRMRQLRKCMMEVGWDVGSLLKFRPGSHMWSGRKCMLEMCPVQSEMPNIGSWRSGQLCRSCWRWVR